MGTKPDNITPIVIAAVKNLRENLDPKTEGRDSAAALQLLDSTLLRQWVSKAVEFNSGSGEYLRLAGELAFLATLAGCTDKTFFAEVRNVLDLFHTSRGEHGIHEYGALWYSAMATVLLAEETTNTDAEAKAMAQKAIERRLVDTAPEAYLMTDVAMATLALRGLQPDFKAAKHYLNQAAYAGRPGGQLVRNYAHQKLGELQRDG